MPTMDWREAPWPTPTKPPAPPVSPTRVESDEELLARLLYVTGKTERLMQELSQVSASAQLDAIAERYHLKRRQVPL